MAKEKRDKEAEIKSLNIVLTTLRAEKTRNEESVTNYKEYKQFLDSIADKNWIDEKDQRRRQRREELKRFYVEKWLEKQK